MHLSFNNLNDAFRTLVGGIREASRPLRSFYVVQNQRLTVAREESRNGPVLRITEPVLVTYYHPLQRVLFNAARDANPMLHVYEALWMLAGHNDVAPLAWYAKQFARYSDDGKTLHGAYGYRWRIYFGYDQLTWIADELRANPTSRRCVLQMWDGGRTWSDELALGEAVEGTGDLYLATHGGKDVPCNLSVMFSVRTHQIPHNWSQEKLQRKIGQEQEMAGLARQDGDEADVARRHKKIDQYREGYGEITNLLDMSVTNRSNDMIWGMLGANLVHLSFLQEYLAAQIGCGVGAYHQFTNNLHVYESNWKPEEWLADGTPDYYQKSSSHLPLVPFPIVKNPVTFDQEVQRFAALGWGDHYAGPGKGEFTEPFLDEIALPLYLAYRWYKLGKLSDALYVAEKIAAADWRQAAVAWLQRRVEKRKAKEVAQ